MLATLVEAVRGTRTLLLVNFRPEFHADWMQGSGYQQLPLPPLGPEAATELLYALLGSDPALASLAARIAAHAGGNPFFVEELVQALVEDGSLAGSRGAHRLARPVDALTLPGTVQAVLAARIDRLAEREKQVLQAAAVIGSELDARILARVSGLAEPELLASLRALAQVELVLERSLYPDVVYGFKHPLTQEVALRSQLGARRAERHAAAARALEALTVPEKLDEQAALLAHHWQEAGEQLAAARWHLRAAAWARSRAPDEVEWHALAVRRLCDSLPVSQETGALGLRARVALVGLGALLLTPAASLREFLREGRAIADRGGDPRMFAEMLAAFGVVRSVAAAVDHREAISALGEAEAIADSLGDRKLRQRVRLRLLLALIEAGRLREADALAEEGVEDPTDLVLPAGVSASLFLTAQRGRLRLGQGRLDEAERHIDHAIEATQRASGLLIICLAFRTELARVRGDAPSASRYAARCAALARPGVANEEMTASRTLGVAHGMRGEWPEAVAEFEKVLSSGGSEVVRAHLAEARLELGDVAAAQEIALAAALDFARDGNPLPEISVQLVLARVLGRADGERARAAIEAALARAELLIAETGARVHAPALHVERAALAQLLGNQADRIRELRSAERLFREIGAPLRADAIASQLRA